MLPLLLMIADVDALVATARARTAAERGCARPDPSEVTVCGRRAADRDRVPFVGYEPGDPRGETVSGERHRLLAVTNSCQEQRAILVGCGFVGVRMTTNARGASLSGRKAAP